MSSRSEVMKTKFNFTIKSLIQKRREKKTFSEIKIDPDVYRLRSHIFIYANVDRRNSSDSFDSKQTVTHVNRELSDLILRLCLFHIANGQLTLHMANVNNRI